MRYEDTTPTYLFAAPSAERFEWIYVCLCSQKHPPVCTWVDGKKQQKQTLPAPQSARAWVNSVQIAYDAALSTRPPTWWSSINKIDKLLILLVLFQPQQWQHRPRKQKKNYSFYLVTLPLFFNHFTSLLQRDFSFYVKKKIKILVVEFWRSSEYKNLMIPKKSVKKWFK